MLENKLIYGFLYYIKNIIIRTAYKLCIYGAMIYLNFSCVIIEHDILEKNEKYSLYVRKYSTRSKYELVRQASYIIYIVCVKI